jgi:hypothetical protein
MKLYIPEQIPPGKDDFPNHPRKVKKWLNGLKQANMGEYTRQIYNGIMQLNRQAMPAKYRLENMELTREAARYIFTQLQKHFVNRTLPLPDKSLKIVNLNQAILSEMAIGYKIIIFEAANDLNKVDGKSLLIASERALHYLSELALRCSQVYTEFPRGTWWDIHHIYALAEKKGLQQKKIKDPEARQKSLSIEDLYKQILLFALARPNSLRQSDAERVYRLVPEWAQSTSLNKQPPADKMNRYFCAKLDSDVAPNCISDDDLEKMSNFRCIDISRLVSYLQKQVDDSDSFTTTVSVSEQISQETLRTLVASWSLCAKRRFSRATRDSDIKVAIGLNSIHKSLNTEVTPPKPRSKKPASMFSLEAIPESARVKKDVFAQQDPSFFITHPNMKAETGKSAAAWDMIAKGRTLTESYAKELQAQDEGIGDINREAPDLHWKVTNVSAGGYCLRWDSQNSSKAQVGELVGIREREPDQTYQWRVGVIRWMQFTREHGLEIGVQVLSPKVISCTVQRQERKNEDPFNCLMLPGIKPIQQPATLLLPAHAFRRGNKLKLHVYERDMEIVLGTIREHTGSFTQFQFSQNDTDSSPNGGSKSGTSSANADSFDSIWSSL